MTKSNSLFGYTDIQKWLHQHPLRQTEIPTEHTVSLPIPTLRWGEPAYAYFASPAERHPGQPTRQAAPDRWWVFRAKGGQVLIYTLTRIVSFAPGETWDTIDVTPASDNIVVLRRMMNDIQQMMDAVVPAFFAASAADQEIQVALAAGMSRFLSPPLLVQYKAMAPDFFQWLELSHSVNV